MALSVHGFSFICFISQLLYGNENQDFVFYLAFRFIKKTKWPFRYVHQFKCSLEACFLLRAVLNFLLSDICFNKLFQISKNKNTEHLIPAMETMLNNAILKKF